MSQRAHHGRAMVCCRANGAWDLPAASLLYKVWHFAWPPQLRWPLQNCLLLCKPSVRAGASDRFERTASRDDRQQEARQAAQRWSAWGFTQRATGPKKERKRRPRSAWHLPGTERRHCAAVDQAGHSEGVPLIHLTCCSRNCWLSSALWGAPYAFMLHSITPGENFTTGEGFIANR